VNGLINPLGIDAANPRLTWRIEDERTGAKQLAYEINLSTDSLDVVKGLGKHWQTGRINADKQLINL
jgi:alpha-L-rhamnosidase